MKNGLDGQLTRRVFSKQAVLASGAVLAVPNFIRKTANAKITNVNPSSGDPTKPSSVALEWMASSFIAQTQSIKRSWEAFKALSSDELYGMTGNLLSQLESSLKWGLRPPEFYEDPVQGQIDLTLPFYLADVADGSILSRNEIGVVTYDKPDAVTPETAFGFFPDSVVLGITNHHFQSKLGSMRIQLIHLAGRHGSDRADSWELTGFLGSSSENPLLTSFGESFKDSAKPEDSVWPYRRPGEIIDMKDHQQIINRILALRGKGILSGTFGISYDFTGFQPKVKQLEISQKQFFLKSSVYSRKAYDWLQWHSLHAAAYESNHHSVLVTLGENGYEQHKIGDIFPEVTGDKPRSPKLGALSTSHLLSHEELTLADLEKIPRLYIYRIAESPNKSLLPVS